MASNAIQEGNVLSWTNLTAAAVKAGKAVIFGLLGLAIALVNIDIDQVGSVAMEGVWAMAKSEGAIIQGDKLWWSPATETVTNTPSLNSYFIGYAAESAGTTDPTVNITIEEFSNEGQRLLTLAATGNQALNTGDFMSGDLIVLVPNTAAKTLLLPSVVDIPHGAKLTVKKTAAAAFAITLDGAGAETIDGAATYTAIDADGDTAHFINTGSAWQKLTAVIAP